MMRVVETMTGRVHEARVVLGRPRKGTAPEVLCGVRFRWFNAYNGDRDDVDCLSCMNRRRDHGDGP